MKSFKLLRVVSILSLFSMLGIMSSGCASKHTVCVIDGTGVIVRDAIIVYREMNMSPFYNRTDAGLTNDAGYFSFSAVGMVQVDAFSASGQCATISLSRGDDFKTIILNDSKYDLILIEYYFAKNKNVPATIKLRLDALRNAKKSTSCVNQNEHVEEVVPSHRAQNEGAVTQAYATRFRTCGFR